MVTLYKYGPAWGQPDMSPFCVKVELYLRMIGVPYRGVVMDVRKGPKGKLPFLDDHGTVVCDSRDIVAHFEQKISRPLDADLTPEQRAISVAFRALVEEEAYFYGFYLRYQDDQGWQVYLPLLKQYGAAVGVPRWIAGPVFRSIRKRAIATSLGQGTGRHTREQVDERLCQVVEAVSIQLGAGPYLLGTRPHVIDATCFAFVSSLLNTPIPCRARTLAHELPNLGAYSERIRAQYFEARRVLHGGAPDAGVDAGTIAPNGRNA
jgi:glutathione S-transferase